MLAYLWISSSLLFYFFPSFVNWQLWSSKREKQLKLKYSFKSNIANLFIYKI